MMNKYTIVSTSIIVTLYIFIINIVSNAATQTITLSILPSLVFLLILFTSGLLHRYVFKLMAISSIFITSIAVFLKWRYKATVTEDILLSGMMNDSALTAEMLSLPLLGWLLFVAFIPILAIIKLAIQSSTLKGYLLSFGAVILLIVGTVVAQGYEYRAKGQIRDHKLVQAIGSFSPLDVFYAYKKALKAKKLLSKDYMSAKNILHTYKSKESAEDRLIVLIIGESTRGDHLSINGYGRETTPKLKKIKNIYSFSHAKSCDTLTLRSMHYMFSSLRCSNDDNRVTGAAFTNILSTLGYQVEIYSLQTLNAFYHYLGYDKLVSKYAVVREQESGAKDKSLLPYIRKSIEEYNKGKKLIVVHTLGSHQSYIDRIDRTDELFSSTCDGTDVGMCTQDKLVDAYDNTILAVDNFVSSIIGMLSQKKAMLVYVSDHGESLGEDGYYLHGKSRNIAPKEQFMIPFLFWFSDSYTDTQEAKSFKKRASDFLLDENVTHDHLFHSILGCAGIESEDGGIDKRLNLCQDLDI